MTSDAAAPAVHADVHLGPSIESKITPDVMCVGVGKFVPIKSGEFTQRGGGKGDNGAATRHRSQR